MARGRFLAALAVTLLLSTGAARATESEERALRDQFADRDEYRAKLLLELEKRQALLVKQEQKFKQQSDKLQDLYNKLSQPVSEDEEDAGAAGGGVALKSVTGKKIPPDSATAKRGKDVDAQLAQTILARDSVEQTRKDIAYLQSLLAGKP
jgi:hypothetical protein